MSANQKIYEIRKTLVSKFAFSLETELEADDRKSLYDEQFLIRMGKEATKLERLSNKTALLMIFIDTLLLLILSGQEISLRIFEDEVASFPAIIEIGLLLASLVCLLNINYLINSGTYTELIKVTLKKRNPDNNPQFFMGSLFPNNYIEGLLTLKEYGFESGRLHFLTTLTLFLGLLSVFIGSYVLHAIVLYLGSIHILNLGTFSPLISKIIVSVLLLINFSGLLTFLTLCLYPFRFLRISDDAKSD